MRILVQTLVCGVLMGCAASAPPALVSVSAWERGLAVASSELSRLERLEIPANAQLSLRALGVELGGASGGGESERRSLKVLMRLHTVDGGTVSWTLSPGGGWTSPVRAEWLRRLDLIVAHDPEEDGLTLTGPASLAESLVTGGVSEAEWARLAAGVRGRDAHLVLAAQIEINRAEKAEPQRHVHHLVIEGARADGDAPASLAFEAAVEVIDRSYRPKQKDKAPPEREDPIREPRPRELAALR